MKVIAEYIWLDGYKINQGLRGKTKILDIPEGTDLKTYIPPTWGFDGSSTKQAEGHKSDCVLKPVKVYKDPLRKTNQSVPNIIVLCEVYLPSGEPHESNTRQILTQTQEKLKLEEFMFGIEQEYTLMKNNKPLGFPKEGYPAPQGRYYCSVGAQNAFGREIVEEHMLACLDANLLFEGINAEVMAGQWEYQIGAAGPLEVADDIILARYLLERIAEKHQVTVTLEPKPVKGDWNGSGAHTNFSTKTMRETTDVFQSIIEKLKAKHNEHIAIYGKDIEQRLTGLHETCSFKDFKAGTSDRGASIRIPWQVEKNGKGYMEDRRPNSNIDPYKVLHKIMDTISGQTQTQSQQTKAQITQNQQQPEPQMNQATENQANTETAQTNTEQQPTEQKQEQSTQNMQSSY